MNSFDLVTVITEHILAYLSLEYVFSVNKMTVGSNSIESVVVM